MFLFITTLTEYGLERHFTAQVNTLEAGLEVINDIAATRDTLLRVHVLEGDNVLVLPVEAFDGRPILAHIQALEEAYKQILRQSPLSPANRSDKLLELILRHSNHHEAYTARLQAATVSLQQQLFCVQMSCFNETQQTRQIGQLTTNLERYQRLLATAIDRQACIEAELRMVTV